MHYYKTLFVVTKALLCCLYIIDIQCYAANNEQSFAHNNHKRYITKDFFNAPNKTFYLKDSYVLSCDITIPPNCTLFFDGGSITGNFTITGNNTKIIAEQNEIFLGGIILEGSWNVNESFPEWFGAKGDGINDDTQAIVNCLKLKNIKLTAKTYLVTNLFLKDLSNVSIIGDNSTIKTSYNNLNNRFNLLGNLDMSSDETDYVNGCFYMSGVTLDCNSGDYEWETPPNPNYYHALALENFRKVTIENCCIKNTLMCGIRLYLCDKVTVRNCSFENIGTETGKGAEFRKFAPSGWQWEAIALTGWKNLNGGSQKVYNRSSSMAVENCYFNEVLNSPIGGANISSVRINNNSADNLKSSFTEFHVDSVRNNRGDLLDYIFDIQIKGNHLDKTGAGFINFSGPFSKEISTDITISNNVLENMYGVTSLHNRASTGAGVKALVVIYPEKNKTKSSIVLKYINNRVVCSADTPVKEKMNLIYCTKVKEMIFKDSYFNVSGFNKETIFYTESGKEIIKRCKFDITVPYNNFVIHTEGDIIMKDNVINNNQSNISPFALVALRQTGNERVDNVAIINNKCNSFRSLVFLNALTPHTLSINKNDTDCEILRYTGLKSLIQSLKVANNKAKNLSIDNSIIKKKKIKNNQFGE